MALPSTIQDRDFNNFSDNGNGTTSRFAKLVGGSILSGVVFDYVKVTYPSAVSEIYTFKSGGSGGSATAIVTLIYTNGSKKFIDEVIRT